jgi:hypothetical protein
MMRCNLADEFMTVALQSSTQVPAKKGVPCPQNIAELTKLGFQTRHIGTNDTDKGYFNLMLSR